MRKRRSSIGKRAIVSAMTIMLTLSTPMVAFSDSVSDHEIKNIENYSGISTTDNKYTDNEAAKIESGSSSVQTMESAANAAQTAAADAQTQLDEINKQLEAANTASANASSAANAAATIVSNAEATANAAQTAANAAQTAATNAATSAATDLDIIDNYNSNAATDNANAGSIATNGSATPVTDADGSTVTRTDSEGKTVDVTDISVTVSVTENVSGTGDTVVMKDVDAANYIGDQADKAQTAADTAKSELEAALAVDTTDKDNAEVQAHVKAANEAAAEAKTAADDAQTAYDAAVSSALSDLAAYNAYAIAYNEAQLTDLFDQLGISDLTINADGTIASSNSEVASLVKKYNDLFATAQAAVHNKDTDTAAAKAAEADLDTILAIDFSGAKDSVDNAKTALDTAATDLSAAKTAAADAKTAAETAQTSAQKAMDKIATYDENGNVTGGDLKTTNDKLAEIAAIPAADVTAAASAQSTAQDNYDNAVKAAKEAYASKSGSYRFFHSEQSYIDASERVKSTKILLDEANSKLADVKATQARYDSILASYDNANSDAEKQALVDIISNGLAVDSTNLNQLEYDQDINTWANKVLNTLDWNVFTYLDSVKTKKDVRKAIDDIYTPSYWADFFNKLGITQWAVDTSKTDAVIAELNNEITNQVIAKYEFLAQNSASTADAATQTAATNGKSSMTQINNLVSNIATVNSSLDNANSTLSSAQNTYDAAQKQLKEVQDKIKENRKSLSTIDLAALKEKLANAQAALTVAKENLEDATAANADAQKYADWASALVGDHYAKIFAQIERNEDGSIIIPDSNRLNYDVTEVSSKPVSSFTGNIVEGNKTIEIPYTIYRAYVKAMYEDTTVKEATKDNKYKGTGSALNATTGGVVYWRVKFTEDGKSLVLDPDENGKYYYTSEEGLPNDTANYLVAYVIKREGDGYHLDGTLFSTTYQAPIVNPTPETPVVYSVTATSTTTETTAAVATPAVLGATRTITEEPAVLGATRDIAEEPAVLGAARNPLTGDNTDTTSRVVVMLAAAGAALALSIVARKKKANN